MKLEYSRPWRGLGNFGDDLNEWIWDEIAPGLLDQDGSTIFLGIGSIIERWFTDRLPSNSRKIVLGSGVGVTGNLPALDEMWTIYGVRGPLSAALLGVRPELVLTDPAMLVTDLLQSTPTRQRSAVGFMPHISTTDDWDWSAFCRNLNLDYINPRDDSRVTLRRISRLEKLITEALHGAIVADALRVPWIAVALSNDFRAMKWYDWGGSLGLPIAVHRVPGLYRSKISRSQVSIMASKSHLRAALRKDVPRQRPNASSWDIGETTRIIKDLALNDKGQLSCNEKLTVALDRVRSAVKHLLIIQEAAAP